MVDPYAAAIAAVQEIVDKLFKIVQTGYTAEDSPWVVSLTTLKSAAENFDGETKVSRALLILALTEVERLADIQFGVNNPYSSAIRETINLL